MTVPDLTVSGVTLWIVLQRDLLVLWLPIAAFLLSGGFRVALARRLWAASGTWFLAAAAIASSIAMNLTDPTWLPPSSVTPPTHLVAPGWLSALQPLLDGMSSYMTQFDGFKDKVTALEYSLPEMGNYALLATVAMGATLVMFVVVHISERRQVKSLQRRMTELERYVPPQYVTQYP